MPDHSLLTAALRGYESQLAEINEHIAAIKRQLGSARGGGSDIPSPFKVKRSGRRRMSAAARKRIAAAQKKRWAAYRKKQKA